MNTKDMRMCSTLVIFLNKRPFSPVLLNVEISLAESWWKKCIDDWLKLWKEIMSYILPFSTSTRVSLSEERKSHFV